MRLDNVSVVDFDIDAKWTEHTAARIVAEMKHEYAVLLVLNESDQLMEAGIKDFVMKGAQKVGAAMKKANKSGRDAYDTIGAHLAKKMQADMPDALQKLKAYAGNHKMATAVVAVIGASLMAMEPAAASQAMDAISQTPIDQFADAAAQQVDQVATAAQNAPDLMSKTQADIVRSSIGARVGDVEITKDMVLDTVKNGKFPGGTNMREYMTQVYSKAPSPEAAGKMARAAWNQVLMTNLGR